MRAKTEYLLEEDGRGKKTPVKIGLAPIQRDGLEYEMDVVADVTLEHDLMVSKTRCKALDKAVFRCAGEDVAGILKAWLSDGAPASERVPTIASKADAACVAIAAAQTREKLAALEARVQTVWASFTADEQERVTAALTEAHARVSGAVRVNGQRMSPQAAALGHVAHAMDVAVKHHGDIDSDGVRDEP
jgi:hypothetical protein